jgi:hypothetical protein
MDTRRTLKRRVPPRARRPALSIPLTDYTLRLRLKRAAKRAGKPLATWARDALDRLTQEPDVRGDAASASRRR